MLGSMPSLARFRNVVHRYVDNKMSRYIGRRIPLALQVNFRPGYCQLLYTVNAGNSERVLIYARLEYVPITET